MLTMSMPPRLKAHRPGIKCVLMQEQLVSRTSLFRNRHWTVLSTWGLPASKTQEQINAVNLN